MKATKVRGGLYRVTWDGVEYDIEDIQPDDGGTWVWRVTSNASFHDPWVGDYRTKREALEAITWHGLN